jgi:hypothetical protein
MKNEIPPVLTQNASVAILVVSFDGCQDLWPPFFHCFFKYWPDCPYPVFLGSNQVTFPYPRVTPVLVGPDLDYTSNLQRMLAKIEQPWIITFQEDIFLSQQVDTGRLSKIIQAAQAKEAAYLKLITTPPLATIWENDDEFGEIPKGMPYRVSFSVILWRKSVLIELLRPGESAWDIELKGTIRSYDMDGKFFCLHTEEKDDPPFQFVHGTVKGRWTLEAVSFLTQEGLKHYIGNRPIKTRWFRFRQSASRKVVNLRWEVRNSLVNRLSPSTRERLKAIREHFKAGRSKDQNGEQLNG